MHRARLTALIATAAVLVAGCGDDAGAGTAEPEPHGITVLGAPEVELDAFDFGYSPDPLVVPTDEPVNVVMRVTSGGHNLRIEGVAFQLPIVEEGDAVVGTLTVDEPGEYRMVCTVPGHEAAGMVSRLVAEP